MVQSLEENQNVCLPSTDIISWLRWYEQNVNNIRRENKRVYSIFITIHTIIMCSNAKIV